MADGLKYKYIAGAMRAVHNEWLGELAQQQLVESREIGNEIGSMRLLLQ